MTKREFLDELKSLISVIPSEDANKYIEYYSEMIDDRMEDGISEEDALKAVGNPKTIAEQILKENGVKKEEKPTYEKFKEKIRNTKLSTLDIVLLIVGFPIWISLLAVVFSIVVTIVAGIFSILVSLWACSLAFIVGGVAGVISGVVAMISYEFGVGIAIIGAGLILIGLSIICYLLAKYSTKYSIHLTKKCIKLIKNKCKKGA